MKRTSYLGLSLCLILALAIPGFGQVAIDDAYRVFYNEKDPQKKLGLGEKYLADFKDSPYHSAVYQTILQLHLASQNWAKVLETAERLPALLPNADNAVRAKFLPFGMAAAQQLNNADKTIEFADRILAVDPNNLQAQIAAAITLPEKSPADQAANDKAFDLATKALAGVEQFFSKAPAGVTPAQWAQEKGSLENTLHSALGLIYLNRKDYDNAITEYETVIKTAPRDGVARFRLGVAFQAQFTAASQALINAINEENAARRAQPVDQPLVDELVARRQGVETDAKDKRDRAIDELATAVAIGGVVQQPSREVLERLYRVRNNDSLEGIDQLISSKK
jgi:tetratricopeptide (TPR) repeat protein